jgi:hypothetical protein
MSGETTSPETQADDPSGGTAFVRFKNTSGHDKAPKKICNG